VAVTNAYFMKLAQLCLVLGTAMIASHAWVLFQAQAATAWLRRVPRNHGLGVVLILISTAWFEWYLLNENLSDIRWVKPILLIAFPAVGIGSCFFLRDFLAARGLAVFLLLLAGYVLEVGRWHDSMWHDALALWAYGWIIMGFWLTMAPWRLRDWIGWATRVEMRLKLAALAGIVWGAFVIALGLTVLK
jgi:hypothetical protein